MFLRVVQKNQHTLLYRGGNPKFFLNSTILASSEVDVVCIVY